MKNMILVTLMIGSSLTLYGMELESLEEGTGNDFNVEQAVKSLSQEHADLFGLIPRDHWNNVVIKMQENRSNLVDYVMHKKERKSFTPEEIKKKYGDNALNDFKGFITHAKAFLHIMGDHTKTLYEDLKEKAQVKLAVLTHGLETLKSKIQSKKEKNKLSPQPSLIINEPSQPVTKNRDNDVKNKLINVLHNKHANLYRMLPFAHRDALLDRFMDQYSPLVNNLIKEDAEPLDLHKPTKLKKISMQKRDVNVTSSPSNTLNINAVEGLLVQDVPTVAALYEQYKVVKALLESVGINMDGIESAVNNDIQLVINDCGQMISNANTYIENKLSAGCTIL